MRVIAVNRFYAPDQSATAQMLTDLAEHLAVEGAAVRIVTSRQRYGDPGADLVPFEALCGVTVHRVWTSRFGRHWLPGRAVDYATFYLFAFIALIRLARPGVTILAKTDPPLISIVAWLAARLRGARLVNWCQDLFPEVAAALGLRWATGPLGQLLRHLRNWSLRSATMNVTLCEAMAEHLAAEGVPRRRIAVIHNWADGKLIRPIPHEHNQLRRDWGLEGRRVIGYSGNLGRAHALPGVKGFVAAMSLADPALVFLFIGGGAGTAEIAAWARDRGAENMLFMPHQPRERLAESLSVPDAHLVSLDPACEGLIMPSKLYGVLAAGRPVIALGDVEDSLAKLVRELDLGMVWANGRQRSVTTLLEAARNPEHMAKLRCVFEQSFDKQRAVTQWASLLGRHEPTVAKPLPAMERAA